MLSHRLRTALDYNRGLPGPVRWARAAAGLVGEACRAAFGWAFEPARQWWAPPMLLVAAALIFVLPQDAAIRAWARSLPLSGDFKRELEALQQFGQASISVVIALAIILLDRPRRRRLLDWIAGAILLGIAVTVVKGLVGRPRPSLSDATHAAGPFGLYPLHQAPTGTANGRWLLHNGWSGGYDLASMPSRHAAFATLAAVFLSIAYPRLRPLAVALAVIVASARVITDAHWASDVLIGAALGLAVALPCVRGYWGVRTLDWLWVRFIDRRATPALPRLLEASRR